MPTPKTITPSPTVEPPIQEIEIEAISDEQQALEKILPWMIATVAHLGIILLAVFLVFANLTPKQEEPLSATKSYKKYMFPEENEFDKPSGSPQLKTTHTRKVKTAEVSEQQTLKQLNQPTEIPFKDLFGTASGKPGAGIPIAGTGNGPSQGDFYSIDTGGHGNVVFLVDASGSMIDSLGFVVQELKDAITDLSPKQKFSVIFFQGNTALEMSPRGLKPATPQNKTRMRNWVSLDAGHIVPNGSSNPMNALQRAMSYRPDVIIILSDNITGSGKYEVDRTLLFDTLHKANTQRRIQIHTIQFLYPDPLDTLKELAAANNGTYKFITENDLGLHHP